MQRDEVHKRRQELNESAYHGLLKTLLLASKNDSASAPE
jgi:hypothetical protein